MCISFLCNVHLHMYIKHSKNFKKETKKKLKDNDIIEKP